MQAVFLLHTDGDGYLKYLLKEIRLNSKTPSEWGEVYPNTPIVFQDKVWLNGEVITQRMDYSYLTGCLCYIPIDEDKIKKVQEIENLRLRLDNYTDKQNLLSIYGNVYWIEEGDGKSFEINKYISGFGSFP